MIHKIKTVLSPFFAHRLTQQVKELYSSTLIFNFAIAAVTIFEPVFLYTILIKKYNLTYTLQLILFFYLAVYVIYFLVLPLGAKFARRYGYERSIAFGTIFTALFYISFFGITRSGWFSLVAIVMYVLWKMFYWPAYHGNFAKFSVDGEQGRQISNLMALQSAVYILGPLVGGFILKIFGFGVLFALASVLIILSNIPMLITKEKVEPTGFSYFNAYRRLFSRQRRRKFLAFLGFGEELIFLVIWPIFIFIVVRDFLGLGTLTAASTLIMTVVFLYIGRATDSADPRILLRRGVIFYFFSWMFRLFSRSVFGVFLIDSYSRIARQSIAIPLTAVTYEDAQDTSVMNTVLFFEMSLVVGKIIAMVLSLILLQFFAPGWNVMFAVAGLMTLLYLFF